MKPIYRFPLKSPRCNGGFFINDMLLTKKIKMFGVCLRK